MPDLAGLRRFFLQVEKDDHITVSHISLYMVLYEWWRLNGFEDPVSVSRRQIMKSAKIKRTTYHKCMKELNAWGYIRYVPSYHPAQGSRVYMGNFI